MNGTYGSRLAIQAFPLLLATACSGGGGGDAALAPIADLTGTWELQESYGDCPAGSFVEVAPRTVTIEQSGQAVTVHDTSNGATYTGTIAGDVVEWSFATPGGGGTRSGSFAGNASSDGNAVAGSTAWKWASGGTCEGSGVLSAVRAGTLPAPMRVAATAGYRQVTLSWAVVPGISEYDIYRSTAAGGAASGTLVAVLWNSFSTTLDMTNRYLSNDTPYYFAVRAVNASGAESPASAEVAGTPLASYPRPATPTGVAAVAGTGSVYVSCDPVAGATWYRVVIATTAGQMTTYDQLRYHSSYLQTSCGVTIPDLTAGTPYYFVVTAWNVDGESEPSAEVSATPL